MVFVRSIPSFPFAFSVSMKSRCLEGRNVFGVQQWKHLCGREQAANAKSLDSKLALPRTWNSAGKSVETPSNIKHLSISEDWNWTSTVTSDEALNKYISNFHLSFWTSCSRTAAFATLKSVQTTLQNRSKTVVFETSKLFKNSCFWTKSGVQLPSKSAVLNQKWCTTVSWTAVLNKSGVQPPFKIVQKQLFLNKTRCTKRSRTTTVFEDVCKAEENEC